LSKHAVPEAPLTLRASDLIFGSDADFVFNAYLALQRQWPDHGGFAHYKFLLHKQPGARAAVLREIAASAMAKHRGASFVDDLPPDHVYKPEQHNAQRFQEISTALRVNQTIVDVDRLNQALSKMTLDGLSGAVEAIVRAQQVNQAALESQLNTLGTSVHALEAHATATPAADAAANAPTWLQHEWQRLSQRQAEQELALKGTQETLEALRSELGDVRDAVKDLRLYTNVELKRQVADYVTAFNSATLAPPAPAPAAPAMPAAPQALISPPPDAAKTSRSRRHA
jgi:hypothetical protein